MSGKSNALHAVCRQILPRELRRDLRDMLDLREPENHFLN